MGKNTSTILYQPLRLRALPLSLDGVLRELRSVAAKVAIDELTSIQKRFGSQANPFPTNPVSAAASILDHAGVFDALTSTARTPFMTFERAILTLGAEKEIVIPSAMSLQARVSELHDLYIDGFVATVSRGGFDTDYYLTGLQKLKLTAQHSFEKKQSTVREYDDQRVNAAAVLQGLAATIEFNAKAAVSTYGLLVGGWQVFLVETLGNAVVEAFSPDSQEDADVIVVGNLATNIIEEAAGDLPSWWYEKVKRFDAQLTALTNKIGVLERMNDRKAAGSPEWKKARPVLKQNQNRLLSKYDDEYEKLMKQHEGLPSNPAATKKMVSRAHVLKKSGKVFGFLFLAYDIWEAFQEHQQAISP